MRLINKSLIFLIFSLINLGCSSDDGGEEMVTPTPQENFGNWSPDFTNQTSDFTQTRTGSQGTEQTRTINVTSSSNTTSSTEEILEEDINEDGDLFEDIEVITITYTGSENLGNHQIISHEVLVDNDMELKVGNDTWSLSNGHIMYYGNDFVCSGEERYHNLDLVLYSEGKSPDTDGYTTGDGVEISLYLYPSESEIVPGNYMNYLEFWNSNSTILNSTFDSYNELIEFLGDLDDESEEGFVQKFCEISETSYLSYVEWGEYENNGNTTSDGDELDISNSNLTIEISDSNVYTIKFEGCFTKTNLPLSFYYKGYLGYYDKTYTESGNGDKSSSEPKNTSLFFNK
jgi:hypothetical protein